jgi:peptidyl-tRNA hydrolase
MHNVADYVLGKFTSAEEKVIEASIELIANNMHFLLAGEIEKFKGEILVKRRIHLASK